MSLENEKARRRYCAICKGAGHWSKNCPAGTGNVPDKAVRASGVVKIEGAIPLGDAAERAGIESDNLKGFV